MHYAAVNGIQTPKVLGVYDVMHTNPEKPTALAMVSDRVPGDTLHYVWGDLTDEQKSSVKAQLRTQIARMRTLTQPFIGRLDYKATFSPYEVFETNTFGPFPDEEKFDKWCLRRLCCDPSGGRKWRKCLERQRRQFSGKFVLTHGDLSPRNILYKDGMVTGIVDWGMSGFYPEYAEYAFAMGLSQRYPDWWVEVLKHVLEPCSKDRVKFTKMIEEKLCCGWHSSCLCC